MNNRHLLLLPLLIGAFVLPSSAAAQGGPPGITSPAAPVSAGPPAVGNPAPKYAGQLQSFAFQGAPLEIVLEEYCRWTGKIYLKTDAVTASITVKADSITTEESIKVIEAVLAMNNIALVPMGDRYLKVIKAEAPDLVGQGVPIRIDDSSPEVSDQFITQIIPVQNVSISEVQAAAQHLMHSYGKIMTLERSNSLMITDTSAVIKRVREIIDFIDQAASRIDTRIYEIKYTSADEIAGTLNEVIAAAQEAETEGSGGATVRAASTAAIRARQPQPAVPTAIRAGVSQSDSPTGIIQGTVKVLADERTNILIIFSQKENFDFFDTIINMLDVEVEPVVNFEVVCLEYADAEDLSGTLNELIGAAQDRSSSSSSSSSGTRTAASLSGIRAAVPAAVRSAESSALNSLSYLSDKTKILADDRSNSILLMGEKADIQAIKNVIASLDIMLEQVLIEAAIFEVQLDDKLEHGIKWFFNRVSDDQTAAGWGGNALSLLGNIATNLAPSADVLSYYQTFTDIDLDAAIRLLKTDGNANLLSTPVVMTTDNTEASIIIGEQRPIVTSTDSTLNSTLQRTQYEYKDIGIQLTVTPRINPQRFVVMEIEQKADQVGTSSVSIDNNDVPIILNREIKASIGVPDRGTIALGGLITKDTKDKLTKIPILGDIPLLGRYLFSSVVKEDIRRELLVLLTPYVLTTPEEMQLETERLYKSTGIEQKNWPQSDWSQSRLRYASDKAEAPAKDIKKTAPDQVNQADMQNLLQEMSSQ